MTKELIDTLREESESEHVAFTQLCLAYKKNTNSLYCLFEGNDDKKYYGVRIKHIVNKDYKDINCGGKDAVLKAYELIKSKKEYSLLRILFFIDKDYDDKIYNSSIYVTPCYSIENFYTSTDVLIDILCNEFSLSEDHEDFEKVISIYHSLRDKFHKDTTLLNSWLSCQHDLRIQNNNKTYLHIDNATNTIFKKIVHDNLKDIFDISQLNDVNLIENTLFPDSPKIDTQPLDQKILNFTEIDKCQLFRGKFELKFIISFLNKLQNEICKKRSDIFSERHRCNLRFEFANAISTLTQYAYTPRCLVEYLNCY